MLRINFDLDVLRCFVAGIEVLLAYARRLLALNDEAVAAVRGIDLAGAVRIGMQEDFGENLLTRVPGEQTGTAMSLRTGGSLCMPGMMGVA